MKLKVNKQKKNNKTVKMTSQKVLEKLKKSKLLTVQNYERINPLDKKGWAGVDAPLSEYDKSYKKILKDNIGVEIEIANSDELNNEIKKVREKSAEKVADMWIDEAKEVKGGVSGTDVKRAATLYLALKQLIKKHKADAITMASWHLAGFNKREKLTDAMPPLAWMELSKENIPCCCESLIDCLVTQMVGTYITDGYSGFVGDILNDWTDWNSLLKGDDPGDVIITGHCGGPVTPHGNDRIPYTIREHVIAKEWADSFDFKPGVTPTATTIEWPSNEKATIIKFDIYGKKVFVGTGTVLDGNSIYRDFDDTMCRSKMVIKIDNPEVYKMITDDLKYGGTEEEINYGFRKDWGLHLVSFYGDLADEIKNFAKLIKFEVRG